MNQFISYTKEDRKRTFYFLVYSICFFIMAWAIFSVFYQNEKTLIWTPDGLTQHFNALVYYRRWLLDILGSIFVDHHPMVTLWDSTIGYGSDVITTLHYYVIGDPLNLLSVFVKDESQMEGFFCFLIILRIYLAGLAFSAFCMYQKQSLFPTLMGTLIYDFCFWVIVAIRHPYFLNPMIYLPLIFIGVDRILKKKSPWLYVGMLAVAAISNFYFAYMICFFIVVYTVIRYIMIFRQLTWGEIWRWMLKFLGYSLVALALSAVILVPVIAMTLSTQRAEIASYVPTFYPLSYYVKLVSGFMIGGSSYWSELGYTGLAVIGIFLLLLNRNRYKGMKLGLIVLTLLLIFPFGGHLLNGGSYVINRFIWCYSFLVSYIFVKMYPTTMNLRRKKKLVLLAGGGVYALLCITAWMVERQNDILVALLMFGIMLLLIVLTSQDMKMQPWFQCVLLIMVMSCLIYQGRMKYSPAGDGYVEEFADSHEALNLLTTREPGVLLSDVSADDFYRYETAVNEEDKNVAMQIKENGVGYYFSLANPYINQFQRSIYLNQTRDFCYSGLDGRTALDLLAGVRYYVVPSDHTDLLPYGYTEFVTSRRILNAEDKEKEYAVYSNPNALPLGFTTSSYIEEDDYDKMNSIERQQALTQGAVIDTDKLIKESTSTVSEENQTDKSAETSTGLREVTPVFRDREISYVLYPDDGIQVTDNGFRVTRKGSQVSLVFEGTSDSETYLLLEGLNYEDTEASGYERPEDRVHLKVKANRVSKKITYLSRKNNFYSGVDDFLLNMGYKQEPVKRISLTFTETGTYTYDYLGVICQPMGQLTGEVNHLKEDTLENVKVGNNEMTGTVSTDKDKLLCVMIPYSEGWNAYVDGEETQILLADKMYMALPLSAGEHEIRLVYGTPYLMPGCMISVLGVVAVVVLVFLRRSAQKKEEPKKVKKGAASNHEV